jgi:SAM-dependent methyltransferase
MVSILSKPLNRLSHLRRIPIQRREALMHHWYQSDLGSVLVEVERQCLKQVLRNKFGHHLVQIDSGLYEPLVENAPVGCQTLVSWHENRALCPLIRAVPEQLPFRPDSIDQILLHHTLDLCDEPHRVLREAVQALTPGGHLVIVGFNPWSLWFVRKWFALFSGRLPWAGRFLRAGRIEDWLQVLDSVVEERYSLFHLPPINSRKWVGRLSWLDRISRLLIPRTGASYVMVARKLVGAQIGLGQEWPAVRRKKSPLPTAEIQLPKSKHD